MTLGLSPTAGVAHLTDWAATYTYAKLHLGDPGANGTANAAVETDRVAATWDTPSSAVAGVVTLTHTNAITWTAVAATEDYTHVSFWTASTAGVFGGSGLITADAVTVGNNFQLSIGAVIISQPVAA